jgi:DNA polymerase III delta prime subunit
MSVRDVDKVSISEAKALLRLFLNIPQPCPPFMHGPPGVGKSAIVYQMAIEKADEFATGDKCGGCKTQSSNPTEHVRGCPKYHLPTGCALCVRGVTKVTHENGKPVVTRGPAPAHIRVDDVRLALFDPVEVKGLPFADPKSKTTQWFKPEYLNTDDDVYSILFLDEFSNACEAVQNAALQLVYDRRVHSHALSKRCMIVLAGNQAGDGTFVHRISSALNNRVAHIEIVTDAEDFLAWARENAIRPEIIGAISTYPDTLMPTKFKKDEQAQPNPRSWEFYSRVLDQTNAQSDVDFRRLALPLIGPGATTEFMAFLAQFQKVCPEEIVNEGKMPQYDTEDVSQKYAYSCAVAHWVKVHAAKIVHPHQAQNIFKFLGTLGQIELKVKTLQDMNLASEIRLVDFFRKHAKVEFTELMSRLATAVVEK